MNQLEIISKFFNLLGYNIIYWNAKPSNNGPDCIVQKGTNKPLSVEVKTLKKVNKTGSTSVAPVSGPRKKDDLIAIIINKNYVLIEPMKDHLNNCSSSGYRPLGTLK